jgi:uncharacterized protein YjiS (DUF1127 family)
MSTLTLPRLDAEPTTLIARLARMPANLLAAAAARRRLRRELDQLYGMDARTLADIGLHRGDIERAVRSGRPLREIE